MHMYIMAVQPNQGSRSKETQNREITPENADRMQNAHFRARHRGYCSPSRSASGTGSIQTIWAPLHRSFAPRQRVVARTRAEMPPSLGREKIVRKFTIWAEWTSRTPNKSHTRTPRCTALPTEALQPPSKRERGSSSRRRTAPKNKKNHPVQKPTMSLDLRTTDTLSCGCIDLYHWAINPFTAQ